MVVSYQIPRIRNNGSQGVEERVECSGARWVIKGLIQGWLTRSRFRGL